MDKKPLSPHLQIYRPQLTSILSISHRASGIFLGTAGLATFLVWVTSIALGPEIYEKTMSILRSPFLMPIFLAWTGAFYYHLSNGVRHLFWDAGMGLDLAVAYKTGYLVVTSAISLTIITWTFVFLGNNQ